MGRLLIKVDRQPDDKRSPYLLTDDFSVEHPMIYRQIGKIGGIIRQVEATGRRDRSRFEIVVREGTMARGLPAARSRERVEVLATAQSVKGACRRLRQSEADAIDTIDAEIARLEAEVDDARERREKAVRLAWRQGNVVRLSEMRQRVQEAEADRRNAE